MKAPMSYVPALPAAIGLMAGILIYYGAYDSFVWPITAFVISAVAIGFRYHWSGFSCLFFAIGWTISYAAKAPEPPDSFIGHKGEYIADVEDVRTTSAATVLELRINNFLCQGMLPDIEHVYRAGDIICFTSKIDTIAESGDVPDEIVVNPMWFVDGITAQTFISPDKIKVIGSKNTLRRMAQSWQESLRDLIYKSPISSATAWFLNATLLGDDSMLDDEIKEEFRATGTAHYLALSGFHVGIIAMFAGLLFFPFKTWSRVGRYRHVIVILLIWLYTFACGMSASLVRASVLISIFLLAKVLQRQSSPYNSLCIAVLVILVASPRQIYSAGFQLSFAAVLSILVFAPVFNPISQRHWIAYRAMQYVSVTLAATLGTCLIMLVHFHRFPLLFLLPNVLLGMLMPLMLGAGIILMITTAFGLHFSLLGSLTDFGYLTIERLCDIIASLGHAEIRGIYLPASTIFLGTLTVTLLAVTLRLKKRWLLMLNSSLLILTIASSQLKAQPAEAELFITRQPLRTDILVRHQNQCRLLTTAPIYQHKHISGQLSRRYKDYLLRRDCTDTLSIVSGDLNLASICRRGNMLFFHDKIIILGCSPSLIINRNTTADYLLLTRSVGAESPALIDSIDARHVLIAADMPPKRAEKIIQACHRRHLPYTHLKEKSFYIKY